MKIWQRHICYCLSIITLCVIAIIFTDPNALINLFLLGLCSLFGFFMALVIIKHNKHIE